MSKELNATTKEVLTKEIKKIQERCLDSFNIIENSPLDAGISSDNVGEKALNYIEGLREKLQNSSALIVNDENLTLSEFLADSKQRVLQVQELTAFTKGVILDIDNDIERINRLTKTAQEALSRPRVIQQDIRSEHILKAKQTFYLLKTELHGVIQSLFPKDCSDIIDVLGQLMQEKITEGSSGYIPITDENYNTVQHLRDMDIVFTFDAAPITEINLSMNIPEYCDHTANYRVMTYINITSVKLFVKVQNIFGVCKVLACLIVIGGGIYEIAKGNTANLDKGFEGSKFNPGGIALALYSGLWAYDGWNSVTVVTEEIINPGVNVPLSISIAVPLITALYVFMNVAYMSVLSYAEMTSVPAVAVAFGARVLGPASFLIPLGVAIATFGCAMSVQFGVTRVCYTAARGGHMLEVFSYVNVKRLTPAPAVAFQAILTSVFILVGNIKTLIEFASWFLWFFYGLAMVALLVLRKTQADKPRPYRVPTIVPCFVLLVAIFLSVLPIVHDPSVKYLMAIGFIFIGVGVYTIFVYYKKTPTYLLRKFTFLTQVLFESVPPSNRED